MDFIMDNYVWFIVIGVIVLMAIIGYFADKTDFGRKTKEEKSDKVEKVDKKKNKKEKNKKVTKIEIDAKGIDELSKDVANKKNKKSEVNDIIDNVNLEQPLEQPLTDVQDMPLPTANETVDQSLFAPLSDQPSEVIDNTVNNETVVSEENANDINTINEVVNDEPESQPEDLKNIEPATLPDIEAKKKDEKVAEEEDIWKF